MRPNPLYSRSFHPSFLALDRAHLGHPTAETTTHLRGCDACRGYLAALSEPVSTAGFVVIERELAARAAKRRFSLAWVFGPASLAAVACAALLFMAHRQPNAGRGDEEYVGAKGFCSVWIYVKRGTETQLWDGKQPLAAGDRVRLKLDPGSYHRVALYSLSDPVHPALLYSGALSPGHTLTLPDAWEIDDSKTAEQLYVVFSDAPVEPAWEDWRHGRVARGVAVLPFILPKTGSADAGRGQFNP
ncbi:MAG: hypothetical protein ABI488_15650 [Polyangiaceae bacterium]